MERFKTEILEEINGGNSQPAQDLFPENEKNDESLKVLDKSGNEEPTKDSRLSGEPQAGNKDSGESATKTGEGATKSETNPKGAGRKPLTPEQREARDKAKLELKQSSPGSASEAPGEKKPNQTQAPAKDAKDSLVNDLTKYKNVTQGANPANAAGPQQIDLSKYISGALLLICMDALMPGIVLYIAGMVDRKYKGVKASKLRMSKEEKTELEPLADEMVKLLFGFVHPAIAFLIAVGVIYAGKLFTLDESDFEPLPIKSKSNGKGK